MLPLPKTASVFLLTARVVHRAELSAPLPDRPCALCAAQGCKVKPVSDLFGALAVCDNHRAEALVFANIFQGLIIKQAGRLANLRLPKHLG